jgi:beta-glucosidase
LTLAAENMKAAENVAALKIPTVLIVVSGRPVLIGDLLDQASACIAAWLPGSEGQGVADVLFGDCQPTAHLSFTWPKSLDQLPRQADGKGGKPLFEFAYGLTYGE